MEELILDWLLGKKKANSGDLTAEVAYNITMGEYPAPVAVIDSVYDVLEAVKSAALMGETSVFSLRPLSSSERKLLRQLGYSHGADAGPLGVWISWSKY